MDMLRSERNATGPTTQARDALTAAVIKNVITVLLCICINYINGTLVLTFTRHQIFYMNPRYIIFIHLVINDMILLTLFGLIQVLSYILFTLNVSFCILLIIIAILANLNTPLTVAVMAVDCYIAICFPLRHAQICTVKKSYLVIGLIWVMSGLSVIPDLFVTLGTEPLGFFHSRVFCLADSVFRNPFLKDKRHVYNIIFLVIVWVIVFFTYFNILFAARAASADAKKARNTVLLHGFQLSLCMLTYVSNLIINGITKLLPSGVLAIRFTVSIFIQILPRLINPIVYGLRDKTFRKLRASDLRALNETLAVANSSSAVLGRDMLTTAVVKNVIVVALCITINYINSTLVHTFAKHEIFKLNPRYILFIHLVVNDMIQLSLGGLLHVISYIFYTINISFCCILLVISILCTLNTPLNLAGMAIECYIAVCFPLRYVQICTLKRTYILIALIWGASAISILPDIILLVIVEPPDFFHSRMFCTRDMVFRSSNEKRNTSHIICLVVVWLTLLYTYFNVLFAAKAANADVKKARNTLLLHGFQLLLCMMNYIRAMFESALLYLFPLKKTAIVFSSFIFIQIMPRFLSPIVYGVRDHMFRRYLRRYLMCKGYSTGPGLHANAPPVEGLCDRTRDVFPLTRDWTSFCDVKQSKAENEIHRIGGETEKWMLVRDTLTTAVVKNLIVVFVWLLLSYINGSVVATFFRHQVFYEDPRYILFIHMVMNDAVQLTVTVLLFILSYVYYRINVSFCCVFILLAVFTTRNTPVNLASMAVERYIAICAPLRHAEICTARRTYALIGAIWMISVAPDITDLFVTLATESLGFFHRSVFCLRQNVFRDPVLTFKRQVCDALYFSCVFLTLVYTYLRIVFAARAHSTDKTSAERARNTILLHGVQLAMCMLSYISPSVEVVLHLLFPGRILEIRFTNYLVVYILPRFLSPIIYGVRDKKFRKHLRKYFDRGCRVKSHKVGGTL
ncbi:hypothetical protein NHX12_030720 [Muraenolepis orangiensis]|uniref:G-protein coupled receptors family 1 profile domain-containing protein n=1 Tax=Muraenolepis orangiensis TaxID=630683 RepID=A0A9Q0EA22_9TELE|nr:hypothetical protein NHX12_030720 [Muraenolepis orangiensis]